MPLESAVKILKFGHYLCTQQEYYDITIFCLAELIPEEYLLS